MLNCANCLSCCNCIPCTASTQLLVRCAEHRTYVTDRAIQRHIPRQHTHARDRRGSNLTGTDVLWSLTRLAWPFSGGGISLLQYPPARCLRCAFVTHRFVTHCSRFALAACWLDAPRLHRHNMDAACVVGRSCFTTVWHTYMMKRSEAPCRSIGAVFVRKPRTPPRACRKCFSCNQRAWPRRVTFFSPLFFFL